LGHDKKIRICPSPHPTHKKGIGESKAIVYNADKIIRELMLIFYTFWKDPVKTTYNVFVFDQSIQYYAYPPTLLNIFA
jgi:hypothetical protein